MDIDNVVERLSTGIREAISESAMAGSMQKLVKADQDKQAIIEHNHESIKSASNKEILRKQLGLLAEYSRWPDGHEHMAECSVAMVLIYRELTRPDNGWLSRKKGKNEQHEHK